MLEFMRYGENLIYSIAGSVQYILGNYEGKSTVTFTASTCFPGALN